MTLENTLGDDATNVYMAFLFDDPDSKSVSDIMSAFDNYIKGETNDTFERYTFWKRDQKEGEPFNPFYFKLRVLSNFCATCKLGHHASWQYKISIKEAAILDESY